MFNTKAIFLKYLLIYISKERSRVHVPIHELNNNRTAEMADRGPGPIPNRWLNCPQMSENLIADKFLAFKTPLSSRFDTKMSPQYYFHPDVPFTAMKQTKFKLGLWIDLTNTNRFYDRREVEKTNCTYLKLQCRGHGETPSKEQTQSFIELVDEFINDHPVDLIGVHCTHGFNRTGFLIISYMVEKMDCSVEAALMAFAQARPPGIYKQDYINELFQRYEDEDETPSNAPALPNWCFEEDDYYDDTPVVNKRKHEDDSEVSEETEESTNESAEETNTEAKSQPNERKTKKRRTEFCNLNAVFMNGVPGVTLVTDQPRLTTLQHTVQEMCGWEKAGFPGCQPVSMDLNNINLLRTKPYRVSWKADGTRYMMLILKENQIYFFDRDNSCFQVSNMKFPLRRDLRVHIENTLLDGEMVLDKVNGTTIPRFLVYDIITYQNDDIGKQPFFPNRLKKVEHEITQPRYEAMKYGLINKSLEPFSVRHKMFWDLTQAKALLGPKFSKTLSHEPDGLIFQPSSEPYVSGRCDEVLKWKPLNMNSVDFRVIITEESGLGILSKKIGQLYVGSLDTPFAQIKYTKQMKELNNRIIECKYENNQWVFMRERKDKSHPNSYDTAKAVCYSIKYPVTTDKLLGFIEKYRFIDDCEVMPPPQNYRKRTN